MSHDRQYAKRIMVHYFRMLFEASGLRWDSDSVSELEEMVDSLIDAAKNELASELLKGKD